MIYRIAFFVSLFLICTIFTAVMSNKVSHQTLLPGFLAALFLSPFQKGKAHTAFRKDFYG